jgi:hypothetical protein
MRDKGRPGGGAGSQSIEIPITSPGGSKAEGGQGGKGTGTGGKGQGEGGAPPEGKGDGTGFKETRIAGKIGPLGKAIASTYVLGIPEGGEASEEYREVMGVFEKKVRDSLGKEEIPLGYRDAIKKYFDSVCPKENKENR